SWLASTTSGRAIRCALASSGMDASAKWSCAWAASPDDIDEKRPTSHLGRCAPGSAFRMPAIFVQARGVDGSDAGGFRLTANRLRDPRRYAAPALDRGRGDGVSPHGSVFR